MCTSGKKHEYADFNDVTPTVPAQILKIQNGRHEAVFVVDNNSARSSARDLMGHMKDIIIDRFVDKKSAHNIDITPKIM